MKITKIISPNSAKQSMIVKNWYGKILGNVVFDLSGGWVTKINNEVVGTCTNFEHACEMLLVDLKIINLKLA